MVWRIVKQEVDDWDSRWNYYDFKQDDGKRPTEMWQLKEEMKREEAYMHTREGIYVPGRGTS